MFDIGLRGHQFIKGSRTGIGDIHNSSAIHGHPLEGCANAVFAQCGGIRRERKLWPLAVAGQVGRAQRVPSAVVNHQRAKALAGVLGREGHRHATGAGRAARAADREILRCRALRDRRDGSRRARIAHAHRLRAVAAHGHRAQAGLRRRDGRADHQQIDGQAAEQRLQQPPEVFSRCGLVCGSAGLRHCGFGGHGGKHL